MKRAIGILSATLALTGCGGASTEVNHATTATSAAPAQRRVTYEPNHSLEIITQHTASAIVTVRVVFDAGSADDPAHAEGATFLAARLMAEGGAGALSYAEVQRKLFPMAASISFNVDRDQTVFLAEVHRDHLDAFYEILKDVLIHPRLEQVDFDRVLSQTKSELTQELRSNNEEELGKETLQAMIYENHPYGRPALGLASSLDAITLDQVKAQRDHVFCASRLRVGVGGNYPDGFAERVRRDFAGLTSNECAQRETVATATSHGRRVWLVEKPDAASVAISMGMHVDVRRDSADYAALTLAAAYFGQHRQFSGLLMNRMRGERGLNYGDYAYAEHFDQLGDTVYPSANVARRDQYFSIWLRPVRPEHAQFATRMAVRELERFVNQGMTQPDFERMRTYASQYYAFFLQTDAQRLGFAIDDHYYGAARAWLDHLRAEWESLSLAQVNGAIRRHIHPENLEIAIVTANANALADKLASDAPSPITYDSEKPAAVLTEDREIQAFPIHIARDRMRVIPLDQIFQ